MSVIIDFELSLPFEDVQNHMNSIYSENKGLGKVLSFHGQLNLKTRKVVAVSIGSMTEEDKDEALLKMLFNYFT